MRTRIDEAQLDGTSLAKAANGHLVQFYNSEQFLYDTLSRFVGEGLAGGEGVIMIATASHLDGLRARLARNSFDIERARDIDQLIMLDADETLSKFMPRGRLDPALFLDTVVPVVERSALVRNGRVRAYGEMVDILCARGDHGSAVRLEHFWNVLIAAHPLSLLCGYSTRSFSDTQHAQNFRHVCEAHTCVMPSESFSALLTEDAEQRETSLLQRQTRALEVEVEHRKALERTLRRRAGACAVVSRKLEALARRVSEGGQPKLVGELLEMSRMIASASSD